MRIRDMWRTGRKADRYHEFSAELPSATRGFSFTVQFKVAWRTSRHVAPHGSLAVVCSTLVDAARGALLGRCVQICNPQIAEYYINSAFVRLASELDFGVRLKSVSALVLIEPTAIDEYRDYLRQERMLHLAEIADTQERIKFDNFKSNVLKDAGAFLAYRLMRNPTEDLKPDLASAAEAVIAQINDLDRSAGWFPIAKIMNEVVAGISKEQAKDLVDVLCLIVERLGKGVAVQEIIKSARAIGIYD